MINSGQSHSATVLNFSHVLISRPEAESRELAEQVRATGLTPVVMPAFTFLSSGIRVDVGDEWQRSGTRLVVFTSPRAVQFGLPNIEGEVLERSLIGALGPATANALGRAGLRVDLQPEGLFNSEALLALEAFPTTPGEALVIAAPGGRDALQAGLEMRGWRVRVAMVYERVPLAPDAAGTEVIRSAEGVVSVWTSGTAMTWLLERLPREAAEKLHEGIFIVASDRLAALARRLGVPRISVASGADNPSLLEVIRTAAG